MTLKQTKQIKLPTFRPGRCAPHPMPPLQYAVYNIYYAARRGSDIPVGNQLA